MQTQLKGAPLAQVTLQFIAAIKATKFNTTIDLKCILKSLPDVRLRTGYTLGSYRIGDWLGNKVILYPFRKGAKSEYDPGEIHRDIESFNKIGIFFDAKKGDPEAIRILEEREKPVLPFADGQYVNGCLSLEAQKTVPVLKDYLDVDFTPMSIWQSMLLLEEASNYLPNGWHGGYFNGTIILDEACFKHEIRYCRLERSQWEPFQTDDRLIPSVTMLSVTEALITFCRWNDWSGLTYKTYHAFRDGRTIRFDSQEPENLIKYDCGIRF